MRARTAHNTTLTVMRSLLGCALMRTAQTLLPPCWSTLGVLRWFSDKTIYPHLPPPQPNLILMIPTPPTPPLVCSQCCWHLCKLIHRNSPVIHHPQTFAGKALVRRVPLNGCTVRGGGETSPLSRRPRKSVCLKARGRQPPIWNVRRGMAILVMAMNWMMRAVDTVERTCVLE